VWPWWLLHARAFLCARRWPCADGHALPPPPPHLPPPSPPAGKYQATDGAAAGTTCTACAAGLTTSQVGSGAATDCNVCQAGYGGASCGTQCGGANGANYGVAGSDAGTACATCPAMSVGFAFDYNGQAQDWSPATIARTGASTAGDCLASFAQVRSTRWRVGAGALQLLAACSVAGCVVCACSCHGPRYAHAQVHTHSQLTLPRLHCTPPRAPTHTHTRALPHHRSRTWLGTWVVPPRSRPAPRPLRTALPPVAPPACSSPSTTPTTAAGRAPTMALAGVCVCGACVCVWRCACVRLCGAVCVCVCRCACVCVVCSALQRTQIRWPHAC
jgi:hypothetical protein